MYIENTAACLKNSGVGDRTIISSFDHNLLSDFKTAYPNCRIGALMLPAFTEIEDIIDIIGQCYPADKSLDSLSKDDVDPKYDISFIMDILGADGVDPTELLLNLGRTLGAIFPGSTFETVS